MSRLELYFLPLRGAKKDLFFFLLRVTVFTSFGAVLTSYLLSRFAALLLAHNVAVFEQLVYGLAVSLVFYYLFTFSIRHTGTPNLRAKIWVWIHRRYVTMVCELDNNYAETLGSARIFSIIDKGGQAWNATLTSLFQETTRFLIVGITTCILLARQSVFIILVTGIIFMVGIVAIYFFNKRLDIYKLERVKAVMEYDRRFIRSIQSRLEITQNSSLEKNLLLLDEGNENYRKPFQKQTGIQMLMFQ